MNSLVILGITLAVLGIVLLLGELHLSTGGALGALAVIGVIAGGVIAIVGTGQNLLFVIPIAAVPGGACAALVIYAARNTSPLRRRAPLTGPQALVGRRASVKATANPVGQVYVDGALWRARSLRGERLEADEEVVVVGVRDMTLLVARDAKGGSPL